MRTMSQTHYHILGHRILLRPCLVDLKPLSKQRIEQFGTSRQICKHEQVNIVGCAKTAPRIDGQRTDETIRSRFRKCRDDGMEVVGERVRAR